jgi:hypothetical protein
VHQRTPSQTRHLRENPEALHYNSPDCPVYTGQCPLLQGRASLELASFGNSQWLVRYNSPDMSGVHRTVRCDIEATDTSAPMATCSALNARQCAQKSGTPMLAHRTFDRQPHQTASLVVGAINTPNHPPFIASKFSTFQLLTRALAFNSRHTQVNKSSPIPHKAIVTSERDLSCSFELLRLDCFSSFFHSLL